MKFIPITSLFLMELSLGPMRSLIESIFSRKSPLSFFGTRPMGETCKLGNDCLLNGPVSPNFHSQTKIPANSTTSRSLITDVKTASHLM